jgi:uncharacterized protein (TIGR02646 family)
MKHIKKIQTQECFIAIQNFIRDKKQRGEKPHYDSFLDKDLIRVSLLKEQGYVCAYCTQRIEDNPLKTKIEHWKTRDSYKKEENSEGTLDYDNLLVVCLGKINGISHCDSSRPQNSVLTVKPTEKKLIEQIIYLRNGRIESKNKEIDKDLDDAKHLNLNVQILQNNRKKALNDIQKAFEIRCKGRNFEQSEKMKKSIVEQFVGLKQGQYEPYSDIVGFFYKKYL